MDLEPLCPLLPTCLEGSRAYRITLVSTVYDTQLKHREAAVGAGAAVGVGDAEGRAPRTLALRGM